MPEVWWCHGGRFTGDEKVFKRCPPPKLQRESLLSSVESITV